MKLVVAYDISDDRRRARLAARLSMWGNRVQRSVFECTVAEDGLADLLEQVTPLVDLAHDVVHLYHQCQACRARRVVLGAGEPERPTRYWVL